MNKPIILFALIAILLSCKENHKEHCLDIMSQADSIMEASQDSSLVSYIMLENIKNDIRFLPISCQMKYKLLCAKAMNKAYIDYTTDSIMLDVVDYFNSHGSYKEKLEANYLLGCVYRDLKDSPKAIASLSQASKFAKKRQIFLFNAK